MSTVADEPRLTPATSDGGPSPRRAGNRWLAILFVAIVALAAVAASLYSSGRRAPEYETSARLLVSPLRQDDDTLFGTPLIRDAGDPGATPNTAAVLVENDETARLTARRLGSGLTGRDVIDAVTVTPVPDTSVLEVIATDENPRRAAAIATEFARTAVRRQRAAVVPLLERRLRTVAAQRRGVPVEDYSQRDRLLSEIRQLQDVLEAGGDPTLRFVQAARVPVEATGRSRALDALLALAGGLALGLVALFGIERLRRWSRASHRA